jgi:hypothetical protein
MVKEYLAEKRRKYGSELASMVLSGGSGALAVR